MIRTSQDLSQVIGGVMNTDQSHFESAKLASEFNSALPLFSFASATTDKLFRLQ